MFDDESRAAGRSTQSMQYKQPNVRTSATYNDSNIFGAKTSNPVAPTETPSRISKTYQDSNIFGSKNANSMTITDNVRKELTRPATAYRETAAQRSNMNTIFTTDDKVVRGKLRKSSDVAFQPVYERSSPTKRHISEFYGEHQGERYDGARVRPESALSKSVALSPKNAKETKWNELQSNIFLDDQKASQAQNSAGTTNMDRLLSASSKWNSQDAFKKSNNLKKTEDLSNGQLRAFAQNKKKQEMGSDIFNTNPTKSNDGPGLDYEPTGQALEKANFKDNKNEDVKRTQHMFSDILGHDEKNYDYKANTNTTNDPSIPTNLAWNDSRTEKFSPKKNVDPSATANDRKKAFLSASDQSTMGVTGEAPQTSEVVSGKALERTMLHNMSPQEKKGFEMKSELPFGEDSQKWSLNTQPANDSSLALDFDLKSIPKGMDMEALKKAFGGYHVIELKADRNNVSGKNLGSGRVKLRANTTHDVLKLKHDLKEHGIMMLSHFERHNKKNTNYRDLAKVNWHDQYLQAEEGRIKSDFDTAKESKLKNLESEGDIFGNTKGVGKWDRSELEKTKEARNEIKGEQRSTKDLVDHLNWKRSIKGVPNTRKSEAASAEVKGKMGIAKTRSSASATNKAK